MTSWDDGYEDHTERMERELIDNLEQEEREQKLATATKTTTRTELHILDTYWKQYDATLAKIREVKPQTLDGLKAILEQFWPPQGGEAFFPSGSADDGLDDALYDAGWMIGYIESTYLWNARTRAGAQIHYVEGDIFTGEWVAP